MLSVLGPHSTDEKVSRFVAGAGSEFHIPPRSSDSNAVGHPLKQNLRPYSHCGLNAEFYLPRQDLESVRRSARDNRFQPAPV